MSTTQDKALMTISSASLTNAHPEKNNWLKVRVKHVLTMKELKASLEEVVHQTNAVAYKSYLLMVHAKTVPNLLKWIKQRKVGNYINFREHHANP